LAFSTGVRSVVYGKDPGVFLLLSPLAVDSAIAGLFWTLCTGGTLVLPKARIEQDLEALAFCLSEEGVTHTLLVPGLYHAMLDHLDLAGLPALDTVVVAGEACPPSVPRLHAERVPGVRLFNEYGPSEATVWSTVEEFSDASHEVTIGRPLPGGRVYILDADLEPVPEGAPGELCIGGPGVARGYLGLEEETGTSFLANPFHEGRLYRTGDLACWREDGRIRFLGRRDDQFKIRGHRVEPGEIERVLESHPAVKAAAVTLRSARATLDPGTAAVVDGGGPDRLAAFVTPDGDMPSSAELKAFLRKQLPAHMIPDQFQTLERLPRTPAGKLDRTALANLVLEHADAPKRTEPVLPRNDLEARLAEVWKEVLGLERVGIHDDFFEVGGDSLMSIRVIARAGAAGIDIRPEAFFEEPTIARSAQLASHEPTFEVRRGPLVCGRASGVRPPVFVVGGIGGHAIALADLARAMGPEQPFFAFEAQGLDGKAPPLTTIEAIADYYWTHMLSEVAGGYHLLGVCWGATVAFEIAKRAHYEGRPPSSVGLVDPAALMGHDDPSQTNPEVAFLKQRLGLYWDEFRKADWGGRTRLISEKARRVTRTVRSGGMTEAGVHELNHMRVQEAHRQAIERYRPDGSLKQAARLFITENPRFDQGDDPRLVWRELVAPEPAIVSIPGTNSGDAIGATHARVLVARWTSWINEE